MANNRIFWACQAVTVDGSFLEGVQSVGVSGNTPTNTLDDSGRPQSNFKYETKDKVFEVSISRVLSRTSSLFHSWSGKPIKPGNIGWGGSGNDDIESFDITILYGPDTISNIGNGSTIATTYHKCIITNLSYNLTVDGIMTEDITLESRRTTTTSAGSAGLPSAGNIDSGNIIKRQDVSFTLPDLVEDVIFNNDPLSVNGQSVYGIQNITLEMSITYDRLNDIGVWRGYDNTNEINKWTYVQTPIGVTCGITAIARKSRIPSINMGETNQEIQATNQITISAGDFTWNLGDKNFLADFSVQGGDTGGGNAEVTFTYVNVNNDFSVS